MVEKLSELVPFNKLESRILEFRGILPPPVKQERLGVNLKMIEELCQLSRIQRLCVIGDDDGQVSIFQPYIVGATSGGNPRISGSVPELVAIFKPSLVSIENRKEGNIEINNRELAQLLLRYDRVKYPEGIRSPSVWAIALNAILKESFLFFVLTNLHWWNFRTRVNMGKIIKDHVLFKEIEELR